VEEYEADISADDSDLLVVEGAICSGGWNQFVLSRTQALHSATALNSNPSPRLVTGAKVTVKGSDGSEYTTRETGGCYACQIDELAPDVEYYLHIEADGEVYESTPQKPLRTEKIAAVEGAQYTQESPIDVLVSPEAPFNPDEITYYSWTYNETWEVYPDYTTVIYYDIWKCEPVYKKDLFPERGWKDAVGATTTVCSSQSYEGQHIRKLKLYDIDRSNERLLHRYSCIVHQRAISKTEYEYELARRQASSEMGGLFTPQPSALPTNIHCLTSKKNVIGYVGCALNTAEYRFFFTPQDFSILRPQHRDMRKWVEDPSNETCRKLVEDGMYLCEWEDPIKSSDGKLHTAWAYDYQLDVRCQGAYIEKPDFWKE
jgi:hypothetical protein